METIKIFAYKTLDEESIISESIINDYRYLYKIKGNQDETKFMIISDKPNLYDLIEYDILRKVIFDRYDGLGLKKFIMNNYNMESEACEEISILSLETVENITTIEFESCLDGVKDFVLEIEGDF